MQLLDCIHFTLRVCDPRHKHHYFIKALPKTAQRSKEVITTNKKRLMKKEGNKKEVGREMNIYINPKS